MSEVLEVLCQEPDTGVSATVCIEGGSSVRELALELRSQLRLPRVPALFAHLNSDQTERLSAKTIVIDGLATLPDDIAIAEVVSGLVHPSLPIYFRTLEVGGNELFDLRTLRVSQGGTDVARLQLSKVTVGGIGLLGSDIAFDLAVCGVGTLDLIDNGYVDWLNVYRQTLYTRRDVYKLKTTAASQRLREMGGIRVKSWPIVVPSWRGTESRESAFEATRQLRKVMKTSQVVIGSFDNFSSRALLQLLALEQGKHFISASAEGNFGQITVFPPGGSLCYCCGRPDPREFRWYDGGACTLAPRHVQKIVSSLASKLVTDCIQGKAIQFNELSFNGGTLEIKATERTGTKNCWMCGKSGFASRATKYGVESALDWLVPPT